MKSKKSFMTLWRDSVLGTFIMLWLVILNILTLGLVGVWAAKKNPMKIVKDDDNRE
jgi:hypothetical protein